MQGLDWIMKEIFGLIRGKNQDFKPIKKRLPF
jgi:hypothetical protein